MGELELEGVTLRYGREIVVRDFTISVADGEMMSILGPSGAGKTTLLKAVAGLIRPHSGRIRIDGRIVDDLPPEKRDAVMVFQKPLLFPFMDVEQNIAFGLRMQGFDGGDIRRRVGEIMELTGLSGMGRRRVHELSGGQQQRVALGRALVLRPAVLLLDEPLSSLDANLRQHMREFIQDLQAETRTTMLFVTHDQAEALMISHRVSLLLDGRLRQVGPPRELFHFPADSEVARFFGGDNFFDGRVLDGRLVTAFGEFPVGHVEGNGQPRRTATIRPEDVRLLPGDAEGGVPGEVERTSFEGMATRVWIRCRAGRIVVLATGVPPNPGQRVTVVFPPEKIRIFREAAVEIPSRTDSEPTP
ncbi:MAG: ABC transporter ATP-binding protein [Desulfobacterales bacterium]